MTVQNAQEETSMMTLSKRRNNYVNITTNTGSVNAENDPNYIASHIDASASGDIINILTTLYKDPEMAVIREYISNAIDSHLKSGQTKKVKVTLPSERHQEFIVQDFGVGMDKESMMRSFAGYGYSSKKDDLVQKGFNGLGSKSAWMIADHFIIIAVHDGVQRTMLGTKSADSTHEFNVISEVPTDEINGVTIRIPVSDHWRFSRYAFKTLYGFESNMIEVFQDSEPIEVKYYDQVDYKIDDYFFTKNPEGHSFPTMEINVNVGGEIYDITDLLSDQQFSGWNNNLLTDPGRRYRQRSAVNDVFCLISKVMVKMPIGSVDITPARDNLTITEKTLRNIKLALDPLFAYKGDNEFMADEYFKILAKTNENIGDHPLNTVYKQVFDMPSGPERDRETKFIMNSGFPRTVFSHENSRGEVWSTTLIEIDPDNWNTPVNDSKLWVYSAARDRTVTPRLVRRSRPDRSYFLTNTYGAYTPTLYIVGKPDSVRAGDLHTRISYLSDGLESTYGEKMMDIANSNDTDEELSDEMKDAIAPSNVRYLFSKLFSVVNTFNADKETVKSWGPNTPIPVIVLSEGFNDEVAKRKDNLTREKNSIILTWEDFVSITDVHFQSGDKPVRKKQAPSRIYAVLFPVDKKFKFIGKTGELETYDNFAEVKYIPLDELPTEALYERGLNNTEITRRTSAIQAHYSQMLELEQKTLDGETAHYPRTVVPSTLARLFNIQELDKPLVLIPSSHKLSVFKNLFTKAHKKDFDSCYTSLDEVRRKKELEIWAQFSNEDKRNFNRFSYVHNAMWSNRSELSKTYAMLREDFNEYVPEEIQPLVAISEPKKRAQWVDYTHSKHRVRSDSVMTDEDREIADVFVKFVLKPIGVILVTQENLLKLPDFVGSPLEAAFQEHIITVLKNSRSLYPAPETTVGSENNE